jgi:hypothetical protein
MEKSERSENKRKEWNGKETERKAIKDRGKKFLRRKV